MHCQHNSSGHPGAPFSGQRVQSPFWPTRTRDGHLMVYFVPECWNILFLSVGRRACSRVCAPTPQRRVGLVTLSLAFELSDCREPLELPIIVLELRVLECARDIVRARSPVSPTETRKRRHSVWMLVLGGGVLRRFEGFHLGAPEGGPAPRPGPLLAGLNMHSFRCASRLLFAHASWQYAFLLLG
jgi:hypothetical protein